MPFAQSFSRLRQLAGNPVLTCVKPRAQWTGTPSGYAYDADYDTFLNSGGDEWRPTSTADLSSNDYETVDILPGSGDASEVLTIGGVMDDGARWVRVLPADVATVNAAQWYELDSLTYDTAEVTPFPAGAAMLYTVRLTKR